MYLGLCGIQYRERKTQQQLGKLSVFRYSSIKQYVYIFSPSSNTAFCNKETFCETTCLRSLRRNYCLVNVKLISVNLNVLMFE